MFEVAPELASPEVTSPEITSTDRTPSDGDVVGRLDESHRATCREQRRMLALIAEADRREAWHETGARDMPHWVSMRYGVSWWRARRWVVAGHALERLPLVCQAFEAGRLSLDQTVELARFATPQTEAHLIPWAETVSVAAIRQRGDRAARLERDEVVQAEHERMLTWWWMEEERRLGLLAHLPAAEGAAVVRAIERIARHVPELPGEEGEGYAEARRADALVAICRAHLATDPDPDRATVVVHARVEALGAGPGACELEGGTAVHPDTVHRLLCNARVQTVLENGAGDVVGLGRLSREPSAWMVRQVRYRDRECRFPGCGARRFTEAHHVRWWRNGGRTDLDNLLLICSFHHRLVHEHGWTVKRDPDGSVRWFDAGGIRYRAGPSPPG